MRKLSFLLVVVLVFLTAFTAFAQDEPLARDIGDQRHARRQILLR